MSSTAAIAEAFDLLPIPTSGATAAPSANWKTPSNDAAE